MPWFFPSSGGSIHDTDHKIRITWIMRGGILLILVISLLKHHRKCKYKFTLQNEIGMLEVNVYNNELFISTIENWFYCLFVTESSLYILEILHHISMHLNSTSCAISMHWEMLQNFQNAFSRQLATYISPILIVVAVDGLATQETKSSITMPLTKLNWNKSGLFCKGHTWLPWLTNHEKDIFLIIRSTIRFNVKWQNALNWLGYNIVSVIMIYSQSVPQDLIKSTTINHSQGTRHTQFPEINRDLISGKYTHGYVLLWLRYRY